MKLLLTALKITAVGYVVVCILLYFLQEKIIFFPEKLDKAFHFPFGQNFHEMNITLADGTQLNGGLFKADSSRGLIFYLHGNAGSINSWGSVAKTYNDLGYDTFIPDYRGYGKSEGRISSQSQLFSDLQTVYDTLKKVYQEQDIVILGYSIGTGPAAKLAASNHPKLLILQAPYYSLSDMMKRHYPLIPAFILKYKLKTDSYIPQCTMPVVLFHGDQDEVIDYNSSVRLRKLLKNSDTLITLVGQGHNGMTDNTEYKKEIQRILTP